MPRSAETLVRKKPVQVPRLPAQDDGPQVAGQEIEKIDRLDLVVHRTGSDGIRFATVGADGVQGRVGPESAQDQTQRQTHPHGNEPAKLCPMNHKALLQRVGCRAACTGLPQQRTVRCHGWLDRSARWTSQRAPNHSIPVVRIFPDCAAKQAHPTVTGGRLPEGQFFSVGPLSLFVNHFITILRHESHGCRVLH